MDLPLTALKLFSLLSLSAIKSILNIGVNDESIQRLIEVTHNPKFAYQLQRRFLEMFGTLACNCSRDWYQNILKEIKEEAGVESDFNLSVPSLRKLIERYQSMTSIPSNPISQLMMAIKALYKSWHSTR
jgi:pyruvate, orthophosphate dikinase